MNLSFQDLLAIWGPILALTGFMWHHFNTKFEKTEEKIDSLKVEINNVEKRLTEKLGEKIDAVRDRVSQIERQLVPAQVISFEETRAKPAARPVHSKTTEAH